MSCTPEFGIYKTSDNPFQISLSQSLFSSHFVCNGILSLLTILFLTNFFLHWFHLISSIFTVFLKQPFVRGQNYCSHSPSLFLSSLSVSGHTQIDCVLLSLILAFKPLKGSRSSLTLFRGLLFAITSPISQPCSHLICSSSFIGLLCHISPSLSHSSLLVFLYLNSHA